MPDFGCSSHNDPRNHTKQRHPSSETSCDFVDRLCSGCGSGALCPGGEQTAQDYPPKKEQRNSSRWIVINDLDDGGERYPYDLAVGALDSYAGRAEGLAGFHAAHDTADAMPVAGHNLDIAFAVKRPQRGQGLGDFHSVAFNNYRLSVSDYTWSGAVRKLGRGVSSFRFQL
jgi:GNAT superfamily N-acetyltransferase